MPKGRVSIKDQLEQYFKSDLTSIFNKYFKGIKTILDALEVIPEITKGTVKTGSVTLLKMLYEEVTQKHLNLEDFPFGKIEKTENGHRGKKPIRLVLEEKHGKSIWDVLNPFQGKPIEEAAKTLGVCIPSLNSLIQKAIETGEIKDNLFAAPAPKGRRGKKSLKQYLIEKHGENLWSKVTEYSKWSIEEASKELHTTPITLIKMIEQGIEDKEIERSTFEGWIKVKKDRRSKQSVEADNIIQENKKQASAGLEVPVIITCSKCGHKFGRNATFFDGGLLVGLKSTRCPECAEWATGVARFIIKDTPIVKAMVDSLEAFVNEGLTIIPNPFEKETKKSLKETALVS